MAKNRSSSFDFGEDMFDKVIEVNKDDEIEKVEKVNIIEEINSPKTDEINEVEKIEKVIDLNEVEKKIENVEPISNIIEVKKVDELEKDITSLMAEEQKLWLKLQARKQGITIKQYMTMVIPQIPICDDPILVMQKAKVKKGQFRVLLPESIVDEFHEKARKSNLSYTEYLWYTVEYLKNRETGE